MIRMFRVILPVSDIERAAQFYGALLDTSGSRVSPGRHYFGCGDVILACFDPRADGDPWDASPNPDHVYFSATDLEGTLRSARDAGAVILRPIETQPWGERSFYCKDPFGNKLCFVAADTLFTAGLLN
jgi:predicted enzyme related to lactoylglutathione lyase